MIFLRRKLCFALVLLFFLQGAICFAGDASDVAKEKILSVPELRMRFARKYACPRSHGLASFTVEVRSDQIAIIGKSMGFKAPKMVFHFLDSDQFHVVCGDRTPENQNEKAFFDAVQAVTQTVEGFFQSYFTVGFSNLLDSLPASATAKVVNERIIVEYPDDNPDQLVVMNFDADFTLSKIESRDLLNDARSVMRPVWEPIGDTLVLKGLEIEYFQEKYAQANFMTRMRIKNSNIQGFLLPTHVTLQARDGVAGRAQSSFFDFHFENYRIERLKITVEE